MDLETLGDFGGCGFGACFFLGAGFGDFGRLLRLRFTLEMLGYLESWSLFALLRPLK